MDGPPTVPATVSVIIPCYNYGHFLDGCVASVLEQRGVRVRVLIVDDRSSDDTAMIGRRLAEQDERVEFRCHSENIGLIATVNEGLRWAQDEFVLVLSADDLLTSDALWRATAVMKTHPSVGMVYGRCVLAGEGHPFPQPSGRWRATDLWSGREWLDRRCHTGHNCISSPEALVRTSVQQSVGGYDPGCYHCSDLNIWLRIAAVADVAYIRGAPQAIYRVHADSMLRSQDGPLMDLNERRQAFESFFAMRPEVAGAQEMSLMATRALARQALWQASRGIDRGDDSVLIDALIEFALDVHPETRRLREWRGLRVRRRIGAGRSLLFLPFVATGAAHRVEHHVGRVRWRLRGI
jgi:hypothetical protein